MTRSDIQNVLATAYPSELVDSMLASYENALAEYKKEHWQYFGNEIGQFVEVARRMIEYQLDNRYTPLADKLANFNERILTAWENYDSKFSEVYRIVIPRCLYSMYCLRNKRGMIHKSHIDPNRMDASVLLSNTKWVLAEIFRQISTMSFEETEEIVNSIMCKESSIVWDTGNCLRILDTKMSCKNKVLCLLYMKDGQSDTDLQKSIEYKNTTEFKHVLRLLHKEKFIEYADSKCIISPKGLTEAENLLTK
ncbi:MAG: hypothetical protein IJO24_09695 [Clostridia bacterium]|nr:hypothetical protein [Clostridia bacterium]